MATPVVRIPPTSSVIHYPLDETTKTEISTLIAELVQIDGELPYASILALLNHARPDLGEVLSKSVRLHGTYQDALSSSSPGLQPKAALSPSPITESELKEAVENLKNPKGWWFGQKTKKQLGALEVMAQAGEASAPYFDDIYFFRNAKGDVGRATRKILVHLIPFLNTGQLESLAKSEKGNTLIERLLKTLAVVTLGQLRAAEVKPVEMDPPKKERLLLAALIQKIQAGEDLGNADLSYMAPLEINLHQVNLMGADLTGTDLRKSQIDETTKLTGANLKGVKLTATQLMILKKGGSRLGVDGFHDFRGVVLDSEDLSNADLSHMDLRGAQFFGTCLTGANINNLRVSAQTLGMMAVFGKRTQNWIHDFRGINLSGEKLQEHAVSSIDLKDANMEGTLFNRDWLLSIIKGGSRLGLNGFHDLAGISLEGADLRGLDLSKVNLKKANLTNALMDLKTMQSIIASGSRWEESGLHDFTGVNLTHVDLRGVDLSQLNLKGASLKKTRLDVAAFLALIQSGSRLMENGLHDLTGVDLQGIDLRSYDLSKLNLKGANLDGTHLDSQGIQDIVKAGSRKIENGMHNLSKVDLSGEDLRGITIDFIDLSEAKLSGIKIGVKQLINHILSYLYLNTDLLRQDPETIKYLDWSKFEILIDFMSFKEATHIFNILPDVHDSLARNTARLLDLAITISRIMDADGLFQTTIHSRPTAHFHDAIGPYVNLAKDGIRTDGSRLSINDQKRALSALQEIAHLGPIVHAARADRYTDEMRAFLWKMGIHADFTGSIFTLDSLSALSVKLRETANQKWAELSAHDKSILTRLAISLDKATFGLGAYVGETETNTAMQAKKMGTAIHVLYGAGFGDPSWIYVGNLLIQLAQKWDQTPMEKNRTNLHRFGVLALKMVEEVKNSYHDLFDKVLNRNRVLWDLSPKERSNFTRSIYRTGAVLQLGRHLESLGVKRGSTKTVKRVMDILSRGEPPQIPYQAYFFDQPKVHEYADDVRVIGGKGRGLVLLTRHEDEVGYKVARGFTLPAFRLNKDILDSEKINLIMRSIKELEESTGLSFEKGTLKVSVRSGGAVSMPGMMDTILDVDSIAGVLKATEEVYNSWDTPRSREFRKLNGIPARWGTAVNIQVMVPATDGAGVAASFSGDGKNSQPQIHYGKGKTGEEVVNGESEVNDPLPENCEVLLKKTIAFWENKLGHPVELEYTIDRGQLYILQLRTAHLDYEDEIKWVASQVHQNLMTKEKGIEFLGGARTLANAKNTTKLDLKGGEIVIARNVRGSGLPYVGQIAFDAADIASIQQSGAQAVYVTNIPDAAESAQPAMQAGAAISSGGNVLSHLAGVAKTMNLPHVSGVPMTIEKEKVTFLPGKTDPQTKSKFREEIPAVLNKGDTVSLDPKNGRLFKGAIKIITAVSEVAPLIDWLLNHETPDNSSSGSGSAGGGESLSLGMDHQIEVAPDEITASPEIPDEPLSPSPPDILPFAGAVFVPPVLAPLPMGLPG